MEISVEEAQLLLTKWKNESASIVLFAELPGARFVLTGVIYALRPNEIRFVCGEGSQVAINISEVAFAYYDPREAEDVPSEGEDPSYHSFLHLTTTNRQVTYALFEPTEEHMKKYLG